MKSYLTTAGSLVLFTAGLLAAGATGALAAGNTHATLNPPPVVKFSAFTRFEITKLVLVPPYAGQKANERALLKIQEHVSEKTGPLLNEWNKAGASAAAPRTLLITPVVSTIKFINGGVRFWAGGMAGNSHVTIKVKISEKETGAEIASPMFYTSADGRVEVGPSAPPTTSCSRASPIC
jgi:hypothetical protein